MAISHCGTEMKIFEQSELLIITASRIKTLTLREYATIVNKYVVGKTILHNFLIGLSIISYISRHSLRRGGVVTTKIIFHKY